MIALLKTIVYTPLYNILVLILNIDWIDAGVATVILTILVKFILYPLTKKSTITQVTMKEKSGELNEIKQKYPDRQVQAQKVMEFYKKNKINPFASIGTILIQIPIIYSLYYIFFKSGLPAIDLNLLYPFVKMPELVSMNFLGLVDVSQKSLLLAALAAISTYLQLHLSSSGKSDKPNNNIGKINTEEFSQIMAKQMKYTFPVVVFFISWQISGVVALYWFVSNVVGTLQESYIRRKYFPEIL